MCFHCRVHLPAERGGRPHQSRGGRVQVSAQLLPSVGAAPRLHLGHSDRTGMEGEFRLTSIYLPNKNQSFFNLITNVTFLSFI